MEDNKEDQTRLLRLQIEFGDDVDCGELYSVEYAGTNVFVFPKHAIANSRRQVLLLSKKRSKRWKVPTFDEDFYDKFESNPHLDDLFFKSNGKMSVDASFTNPDTDEELGKGLSSLSLKKKRPKAIKAAPESVSKDLVPRSMEMESKAGAGKIILRNGAMFQGADGLMASFIKAGRMSDDGESKYQALTMVVSLGHPSDEKHVSV
jgi:hypothetical protein